MKRFACLILVISCAITFAQTSFAKEEEIILDIASMKKEEITKVIDNVEKFSNAKNQKALKKLYSEEYLNDDGFNKEQLFTVIKKTYDAYEDLTFDITIDDIIINDDYAMAFLSGKTKGKTKKNSEIIPEKGDLKVEIKEVLYLKKINSKWSIYYEDVLLEQSSLAYGIAKTAKATLSAPLKVLPNSDYTAALQMDIPDCTTALASINNEPITPDFKMGKEVFRQVSPNDSILERVLKSNNNRQNEMVIASVGLTQIVEDKSKKAKVKIGGLLLLMGKTDVICPTKTEEIKK